MDIQQRLLSMADQSFREFQSRLCPTVDSTSILGVKTPQLRSLARELLKTNKAELFLKDLPHRYFEENQIHAFLISEMKDYQRILDELDRFLPFVDNWTTCDQLRPKIFCKYRAALSCEIDRWIASSHPYILRFGIEMRMVHYLDDEFRTEYLDRISIIRSEEYYVNMMLAWFFATALTKQYDAALPYLSENRLDPWVHNKAIQKARESLQIPQDRKAFLSSLKRACKAAPESR